MKREEFLEKWGYQTALNYGCAQFSCKDDLNKDLDSLIAEEVSQLNFDAKKQFILLKGNFPSSVLEQLKKRMSEVLKEKEVLVIVTTHEADLTQMEKTDLFYILEHISLWQFIKMKYKDLKIKMMLSTIGE